MRFILVVVTAAVAALAACAGEDDQPMDHRSDYQFFSNATRRDATVDEARLVVNLNGCTAFFVDNTQGRTYLMTAQHCVSHAITTWCAGGGHVVDNQGRSGTCTRVIAADASHDVALFEASLPFVPAQGSVLRLAAYLPPVNSRLDMIGYPADNDPTTARHGRLTVTQDCWVLSGDRPSPYGAGNMSDRSMLHNCSTYGGNSGGPMYIEGSLDAVGLPFTYVPDDYHRRNPNDLHTAAALAQTADFVATFRDRLDAAGVVIADAPPPH